MSRELAGLGPRPDRDRRGRGVTDPHARRAWLIALYGSLGVGGGLAVLLAVAGGGGRAGLAALLVGAAVSCAAGSLYAVVTGLVDMLRDRPVSTGRAVAAAVLFALGAMLPAMVTGLGG